MGIIEDVGRPLAGVTVDRGEGRADYDHAVGVDRNRVAEMVACRAVGLIELVSGAVRDELVGRSLVDVAVDRAPGRPTTIVPPALIATDSPNSSPALPWATVSVADGIQTPPVSVNT